MEALMKVFYETKNGKSLFSIFLKREKSDIME